MCPKDFITGRREDQALTPKNTALLLRRDQSLCVKCLDWDRPVTEVWSLIRVISIHRRTAVLGRQGVVNLIFYVQAEVFGQMTFRQFMHSYSEIKCPLFG